MANDKIIAIGKKNGAARNKAFGESEAAAKAGQATHLQVVPADVMLRPGESVEFRAFAYDAKGRRVGEVTADWEPAGMLPPEQRLYRNNGTGTRLDLRLEVQLQLIAAQCAA